MKKPHEGFIAFLFLIIFAFTLFSIGPSPDWKKQIFEFIGLLRSIPLAACVGVVGMYLLVLAYGSFVKLQKEQRKASEIERLRKEAEAIDAIPPRKTKSIRDHVLDALNSFYLQREKRPAHRPSMDDTEAVRLIREEGKTYRQAFDIVEPLKPGEEESEREERFNKTWRSRVSQKVRKEDNKLSM